MREILRRLWVSIMPIIGMIIFVSLFIVGIFVFSYLLIIGAIIGLVLFVVAFIRTKMAARKSTQQPSSTQGRIIEHDDTSK